MVAVFGIFGTLKLIMMKQLGVGLGVAVLIDATIIRGVLLPAAMKGARRVELVHAALARVAAVALAGAAGAVGTQAEAGVWALVAARSSPTFARGTVPSPTATLSIA